MPERVPEAVCRIFRQAAARRDCFTGHSIFVTHGSTWPLHEPGASPCFSYSLLILPCRVRNSVG